MTPLREPLDPVLVTALAWGLGLTAAAAVALAIAGIFLAVAWAIKAAPRASGVQNRRAPSTKGARLRVQNY